MGDAGRMISVMARPFLRPGKRNDIEVAERGVLAAMAARSGNWLGLLIGQSSGSSLVRTPTLRTVRVRASSRPRGGAVVRRRWRSPAWTPTTSIANTAATAPDKNAAITNRTTAGAISGRHFRRLIWRSASRDSPFPRAEEI